ncbi:MAG: aldo/keto reductase [Firmicutes bacterium]|nr:aldo/keto reductase [Bacillota bacterium]
MRYRQFGRCGFDVSALGFGCMRLPCVGGDQSVIREDEAVRMIRYAIDEGVNYVDTAYGYHGGNSEKLVGKALARGYRDRVKLATKLPVWLCKSHDDFDRLLSEQLQRLATDHIDCYLLHSLDSKSWLRARDMGVLEFLAKQMELGRIRYAGFSFHDAYEVFPGIVDAFGWGFCQIMLNYVDVEYQAGLAGLKYAAEHGLAVIVMEPLRGGKLAANLPDEVVAALGGGSEVGDGSEGWSPAEWALRWVWNLPEVSVALSGMSSMEQVVDNIRIASDAAPGVLTERQLAALARAREAYMARIRVACTECGYCQPCPHGVVIPDVFGLYNEAGIFNAWEGSRRMYRGIVKAARDASRCAECGQCEAACPQQLHVIELLKEAHAALAE